MTSLPGQVRAMKGARRDKATHLSEARSRCCTSTLPPPFTASTAFLMLAAALRLQDHMLNDMLRLKATDTNTLGWTPAALKCCSEHKTCMLGAQSQEGDLCSN